MGYTLKIGEAKIDYSSDRVEIDTDIVSLDHAPAFGEPTDRENQRWPSYTGWHDFSEKLGIKDVMFSARNGGSGEIEVDGTWIYPLIREHPGAAPITPKHLQFIEARLAEYKTRHPDHIAQYPPLKEGVEKSVFNREEDYVSDPRYDSTLCRAEWLVFWLRWALENCKQPVFVNR